MSNSSRPKRPILLNEVALEAAVPKLGFMIGGVCGSGFHYNQVYAKFSVKIIN
jgi:hypothetical protein